MNIINNAEKRADIIRRYKDHKLTSVQALAELKKLEAKMRGKKRHQASRG